MLAIGFLLAALFGKVAKLQIGNIRDTWIEDHSNGDVGSVDRKITSHTNTVKKRLCEGRKSMYCIQIIRFERSFTNEIFFLPD